MPIASTLIGAGGSLLSGILGSNAASTAAAQEAQSQRDAITSNNTARDSALKTVGGVYNNETQALAPYQSTGTGALDQLAQGTAPGGQFSGTPTSDQVLAQDPGYAFQLQQGEQALSRAAAAGGGVASGGALKAAAQYSNDYASNSYQNAYSRFMTTRQNNYSNLANLAGMGQTANSQLIGAGGTYGGDVAGITTGTAAANANALTGIGNAQAAGTIGGANAWSSALSGLAKTANGAAYGSPSGYGAPAMTIPTGAPVFNPTTGGSYPQPSASSYSNLSQVANPNQVLPSASGYAATQYDPNGEQPWQ
jgi:hypothetical protein